MNNKEIIKKTIKILKEEIYLLEKEEVKYSSSPSLLRSDEYTSIHNKIELLNNELDKLNQLLLIVNLNPCATSDTVDLYEKNVSGQCASYFVTLHNTKQIIGKVKYVEDYSGNVSYFINEKYRNKGYGYDALLLLIEQLKELNIEEISLHIFENNKISLKMAEKLCQIYSCEKNNYFDILWFKFNIKEKIYQKSRENV